MVIYLASPYSHACKRVRHDRFVAACQAAARLMSAGNVVFSPIAHSHPIAAYLDAGADTDHDFWMRQDEPILARCDRLAVLRLPGWEQSRGVTHEVTFAALNGIPTDYIDP